MKSIFFKDHLPPMSVRFFSIILLLCLNCQQSIASDRATINLITDKANARIYLNGENKGLLNVNGLAQLHVPGGNYTQYLTVINNLEMLEIPAGEFMMGNHDVMFAKPAHPVRVAGFKLSKNEITYELYDLFVEQTGYDIPMDSWGRGKQPVTNVSWYDAQLFIRWLNSITTPAKPYRLPTEAEWEYAARGGTQTAYWWGSHKGRNRANCSDCMSPWYRQTAPVGSFSPNPFGLNDTSGNVYEWVQDCWNSYFEQAPQDGSAWLSGYCKYRVIRGGCWYFNHQEVASASRTWNTATKRDSTIGFRLAQDY